MQKHTPGPWISIGNQPRIVSESDHGRHTLALVYDMGHETTPNARLIAAAPALLEALETLCAYQENLCDYEQDPPSEEVETNAWSKARAAIAAARGEA